jgi:hypothetical protein
MTNVVSSAWLNIKMFVHVVLTECTSSWGTLKTFFSCLKQHFHTQVP